MSAPRMLFEQAIPECVAGILETMFFAVADRLDELPAESSGSRLVGVEFSGAPSGRLLLWLDAAAASALASSFLAVAETEIADTDRDQTACELGNMICGAVVSRLESETAITLSPPGVIARDAKCKESLHASAVCFAVENGRLAVDLELGVDAGE